MEYRRSEGNGNSRQLPFSRMKITFVMIVTSGQLGIALSSNQPAYVKTIFSVTSIAYIYIVSPGKTGCSNSVMWNSVAHSSTRCFPPRFFIFIAREVRLFPPAWPPPWNRFSRFAHPSPRYFPLVNTLELKKRLKYGFKVSASMYSIRLYLFDSVAGCGNWFHNRFFSKNFPRR